MIIKVEYGNVVFLLFVVLIFATSTFGQGLKSDFRDTIVTIHMDEQPLGIVFRYLMSKYDITIGFEQAVEDQASNDYVFDTNIPFVANKSSNSDDGSVNSTLSVWRSFADQKQRFSINRDKVKLGSVIDDIVRQMKNYRWDIRDGVVNITPIRGRDDRFSKLLDLRISSFTVDAGRPIGEITTEILRLPEFREFLAKNNLHFTGLRGGSDMLIKAQYGRKLPQRLSFSKLSFLDLLNKITSVKRGGWILKRKIKSTTTEEHIDIDI